MKAHLTAGFFMRDENKVIIFVDSHVVINYSYYIETKHTLGNKIMNKSIALGNNFYLLGGVIQHRFSSVYFDLNTGKGNIEPQPWLLERAKKVNK